MKTKTHNLFYGTLVSILAPLMVLLLIALVPVGRAAELIPESGSRTAGADTIPPDDVENVKAVAGDGSVTLTWNVATDDVGVKGYKIYYGTVSVGTEKGKYNLGFVDAGNKISYTFDKLTAGTKYYFAVTAYDAAGNESTSYSIEVSATVKSGATGLRGAADTSVPADKGAAPKVMKAETVNKNMLRVVFSEPVQLSAKAPESAFNIKSDNTGVALAVKDAVMDPDDSSKKAVLLTTADQQAGMSYILTAGINVKSLSGNPIISGTSDTAVFTGTDIVSKVVTGYDPSPLPGKGPETLRAEAVDATHVNVIFSKPVVLKPDGRQNFIITEAKNIEKTLEVSSAQLDTTKTTVNLTTAQQKAVSYNIIVTDVLDNDGRVIDSSIKAGTLRFTGKEDAPSKQESVTDELADKVGPEDVTNFTAKMLKKLIVTLSWTKSPDSAGNLANYILYMATAQNQYNDGISVDRTDANFDVTNIIPGVKYFFKLTAKDKNGNESAGVTTDFILPETGPELVLLLLGSLGAGKFLQRRKRKLKK